MELFTLPLNLNQILVHTNQQSVSNTVVAFVDINKTLIVIRPTFRDSKEVIRKFIIHQVNDIGSGFEVIFGDGFQVDTWDNKAENFK